LRIPISNWIALYREAAAFLNIYLRHWIFTVCRYRVTDAHPHNTENWFSRFLTLLGRKADVTSRGSIQHQEKWCPHFFLPFERQAYITDDTLSLLDTSLEQTQKGEKIRVLVRIRDQLPVHIKILMSCGIYSSSREKTKYIYRERNCLGFRPARRIDPVASAVAFPIHCVIMDECPTFGHSVGNQRCRLVPLKRRSSLLFFSWRNPEGSKIVGFLRGWPVRFNSLS